MEARLKFVAYYRVSTEHQRNDKKDHSLQGLGLESQQTSVNQYVKSKDGELLKEFKEIQSGKNKDRIVFGQQINLHTLLGKRPILLQALNFAKDNDAILVVKEHTRLTRFSLLSEYLMATGVRFVCADSPNDTAMIIGLKIKIGEDEGIQISKRISCALQAKIQRDGKHWYDKTKANPLFLNGTIAEKARKVLSLKAKSNPQNIRGSQMIKSWRSEGLTWTQIIQKLNENQFKTSKGLNFVSPNQAIRILAHYPKQTDRAAASLEAI